MKVIIKNLKQVTYEVEVPSAQSTILDLKKAIETAHNFEATQLKLLHLGVVLEDTKKLEDYKIEEGSTIIMMNTKVKVTNNQPQQQQQQQPSAQAEEPKPNEEKKEEKKPEQKQEKPPENKYTSQIASLVDMGFEKSQAEAAIKAAHGQIDRAVDYLYNGIPEGTDENEQFLGDLGQGEEGAEQGEEGGDEDDLLKKTASIAKILCQNNPAKLTTFLQNIQANEPDLFSMINEREEEFKNLLEQPITQEDVRNLRNFQREMGMEGAGEGHGHGHGQGQGTLTVNVTPEDRVVINRLKELGNFNEADVIQAYFACDKNEEMTANYLFEQKMKDDDEMFKNNNNNNNNQ